MDISYPSVSVIIPTHNRKNLLKIAVQSALDQTYKNFEIIIVDNGSTDGTDRLIKDWHHPDIRYFWQEDTGGPTSPRNKAIKLARGEYIAFLDSDDLWLPQKLGKQVSFFEKNKGHGMIFSNSYYLKNSGKPEGKIFSEKFVFDSSRQTEILIERNVVPMLTVMVRKRCLLEAGCFDEDPEILLFEDYYMWLRLSLKYKLEYLPEVLSIYRSAGKRLSDGHNDSDKGLKVIDKFVAEFGHELSGTEKSLSDKIRKEHTILSLEYNWENDLNEKALEALEKICAHYKINFIKRFIIKKMISIKMFRSIKGFRFFIRRVIRYFLGYSKV